MRILLVKTSSLGDVIHNLPVLSDIRTHCPAATVDWCVEESFADIPRLHPGLSHVIPVALRRWRKALGKATTWREMADVRRQLAGTTYDAVIDTQGLLKSAFLTRLAQGERCGMDGASAREPLAARMYDRTFAIPKGQHAVLRNRQLAAKALGYVAEGLPDYGLKAPSTAPACRPTQRYVVLLTATSRDDKLWPDPDWIALGQQLARCGIVSVLPSGAAHERERAARLAAAIPQAIAAPPLSLPELAALLAGARAAVGVDTGLSHLAVALDVPTVAIYTATDPGLTGVLGRGYFRNLGGRHQSPAADTVLDALEPVLR